MRSLLLFVLFGSAISGAAFAQGMTKKQARALLERCPDMQDLVKKDPQAILDSKTDIGAAWAFEQRLDVCIVKMVVWPDLQKSCSTKPLTEVGSCFGAIATGLNGRKTALSVDGLVELAASATRLVMSKGTAKDLVARLMLGDSMVRVLDLLPNRRLPTQLAQANGIKRDFRLDYLELVEDLLARRAAQLILLNVKKTIPVGDEAQRAPASVSKLSNDYDRIRSLWDSKIQEIPALEAKRKAMEAQIDSAIAHH